MPICQIKTNDRFTPEEKTEFLKCMASELAVILDKPLPAVMTMLSEEYMFMNNSDDTVVFAEFRYLKDFATPEEKTAFLKDFADRALALFRKFTSVDPYRVYMQFTEMTREGAWRYTE